MNDHTESAPTRKEYALTTRTVVLILLMATAANATWSYVLHERHKAQSLENEQSIVTYQQTKAALQKEQQTESANAALAMCAQTEQLRQVALLTNTLAELQSQSPGLTQQLIDLRTNEVGRSLAQNGDMAPAMRHLYDHELPTLPAYSEISGRIAEARRLQAVLMEAIGSTYTPEPALVARISDDLAWATSQATNFNRIVLLVRTLTREARIQAAQTPSASDGATLENAIEEYAGQAAKAELERSVAMLPKAPAASASGANFKTQTIGIQSSPTHPSGEPGIHASEYGQTSTAVYPPTRSIPANPATVRPATPTYVVSGPVVVGQPPYPSNVNDPNGVMYVDPSYTYKRPTIWRKIGSWFSR